jgi:DNA-directed RNA polymerase, mitochondrial
VGTALAADLLVGIEDPDVLDTADRTELLTIGVQLLGLAKHVGIIADVRDPHTGAVHMALADSTYRGIQRLINASARHVLTRVCREPPVGVETRKKYSMLLERPLEPLRVIEAANKVQGTAWRINPAVLAVLDHIDNHIATELDDTLSEGQKLQRERIIAEARDLATLERFYFPVFLDFRGRIYQRGGVLTYTGGDDYARGLLEFADGEVVDEDGLGWLTAHQAQMWGNDLAYTPLGDGGTWLPKDWEHGVEQPVQYLAAALAIQDAYAKKPVRLPVRVDATCSGLQHLALLSADEELARRVHLWGDCHGDRRGKALLEVEDPNVTFYQEVAKQTGFSRKEVKCVIIPMLYEAGPETSAKDLAKARRGEKARRTPQDEADAGTIRGAAESLAPDAFGLLAWFKEIAEAHNNVTTPFPVCWATPSGFQAIQDYRLVDENPTRPDRQVKVLFDGRMLNLVKRFYTEFIDRPQQVISMPSSIIHSLDAALLTEIVAGSSIDRWGVVHDAFAVPPSRVWGLLQANEDAMRVMYTRDLLAEWIAAWRADYRVLSDPPHGTRGPLPGEMLGGLRALG